MPRKQKYDFTVECPEKAVFATIKGTQYVYINEEKFKKEGKKGYQYVRTMIGKSADRKVMYPNENFFKLFPGFEEPQDRSTTLDIGIPLVVEDVAKSSGLLECLEDFFGVEEAKKILDLATYTLTCHTSSYQHFHAFAHKTVLLSGKTMSDSTISRFLSETLNSADTDAFVKEWARLKSRDCTAYIFLDSTNSNTAAEGIELAEMGFAKDDPKLPQINFELVIRQDDNLPIYYKVYPGSLVDINQLEDVVKLLTELGFKDVVIVADRGYVSRANIRALDESGMDFLFLLKDCARTDELIEKYGKKIARKAGHYLSKHDVYGMTVRHRLFDNMGPVRSIHITWSPRLQEEQTKYLLNHKLKEKARELEKAIKSKEPWHGTRLKNYRKYFDIETDEENRILSFKENDKLVDKQIEMLGFRVFVSSRPMTTSLALDVYGMRDGIEKAFRGLKEEAEMDVLRGHSDENIEGRFFIYFIDAILRSLIVHQTKKLKKRSRKYYTFPGIFAELCKLEAHNDRGEEKYYRRFKFTRHQKDILDCFKIDEKKADEFIKRIPPFGKPFQKKQAD